MATNLGVTVVDSIAEFLAWLGIETAAVAPPARRGRSRPDVELPEGTSLDDEERRLVEHLYRDCRSVRLVPIGGGYSGSRVFGSSPVDRRGRREIPFVTKIDRHDRIARERVAVEGVENLLGANAPRLADHVDLETRGAIKYHFATMQAGEVRTLQRAFREADGPEAVGCLFDAVITRVLRRLYQAPYLDRLSLFDYYGYRPQYAEATLDPGLARGGTPSTTWPSSRTTSSSSSSPCPTTTRSPARSPTRMPGRPPRPPSRPSRSAAGRGRGRSLDREGARGDRPAPRARGGAAGRGGGRKRRCPPASTGSPSSATRAHTRLRGVRLDGRSAWPSPAPSSSPPASKTPSDRGREGRARRGAGSGRPGAKLSQADRPAGQSVIVGRRSGGHGRSKRPKRHRLRSRSSGRGRRGRSCC